MLCLTENKVVHTICIYNTSPIEKKETVADYPIQYITRSFLVLVCDRNVSVSAEIKNPPFPVIYYSWQGSR